MYSGFGRMAAVCVRHIFDTDHIYALGYIYIYRRIYLRMAPAFERLEGTDRSIVFHREKCVSILQTERCGQSARCRVLAADVVSYYNDDIVICPHRRRRQTEMSVLFFLVPSKTS